ncbi:MAG: hypothetical protein EXR81_02415 [Gammaproteobacteria bacterium]|nr:hypothetical protein [Gammaproteobacteria bacterium]
MQVSNHCNNDRQLPLTTGLMCTVIGDDGWIFRGNSNSMSRSSLMFETNTSLRLGMLLEVKLDVAAGKSLGLQAMVKVVAINRIAGSNGYQVNSAIEEMALKI